MPQYRSIESIVEEERRRADRPSTLRPTDDDLYAMSRESWRHLHSLMAGQFDQSRDYSSATISVVSGTRSYDLPTNCWRVLGVKVPDTSSVDGYVTLDRFVYNERHTGSLLVAGSQRYARYEVRGSQIHFDPTPKWSATVTVEFIPYASWTQVAVAAAPTTASTQLTGGGNTTWRVNLAAVTIAVGSVTTAISAQTDFVVHSGSCLVTNGQSCRAAIVAKNVSGVITTVAVKGAAATTGSELAPTKAEIQTAVGKGNSWTRLANIVVNRTADTTLTQSQDSVDCIDAANGTDEWLVCDVAAKIKAIDEEDASYFIAQREAVLKRLQADAVVDVGKPKRVANVKKRRATTWWV